MATFYLRILGGADVGPVDAFEYYAGEERTLTFQIMNSDTDVKEVLPLDITNVVLTFPTATDDLSKALVDADNVGSDRSIITAKLVEDDTTTMISGWMKLQWDAPDPDDSENTLHRQAFSDFIQTKLTTGN